MLYRCFYFSTLTFLMFIVGCVFLSNTPSTTEKIVDPLIIRNQQWREQVELAETTLQNRNIQEALTAYQNAFNIRPNYGEIQFKIAELYIQLNEYEKAKEAFLGYLHQHPNHILSLNYVGYIYEILNDYENAAKFFEQVIAISKENLYALNHLGLVYKELNQFDNAEYVLRTALNLDPRCENPDSKNLHNYLGLIYLSRGDVGEAIAEYRESIRLFPQDVWARQQLASLYEDNNRFFEAQLQYQKLLEIDPENLLAISRLEVLSRINPNRIKQNSISPVNILNPNVSEIIANAPTSDDYPDADVAILFNHFSHDVLPSGQSRYTTHQLVKILTRRGIHRYGDIAIPYQPNTQNIMVNIARTITPDGTIYTPPDEAYNDVSPPGLLSRNLYSDMMWKVISMVGLSPGVCIEYQVTLEDKLENVTGNETWITGGYNFQSTELTLETTYALRLPRSWKFQWKMRNSDLKPLVTSDQGGTIKYIWTGGESTALKLEDGMPNINDVVPRLTYSSINTWERVYDWYKSISKGRYAPDEQILHTVVDLTENLNSDESKISAIYDFVARQIRYVGIELGESAYQPSPATEVLKKQYGDCKDKATLLISMLDLVGIRAYPVMLSTSPYQKIDTSIPTLSQFNHMIVAIPTDSDKYLWLDPTSSTCSYRVLPYINQGRKGFLIGDSHGKFVEIPVSSAEKNRFISNTELWLSPNGAAKGVIRVKMLGQNSINPRWNYQQIIPANWNNTFASELSNLIPNISVDSVKIENLHNIEQPLIITLNFSVNKYIRRIKNQVLLPLPIDEFTDYSESFSATERSFPLNLSYPMRIEKTIRIHLPEEWTATLPTDIRKNTEYAEMERRFSQLNNTVSYDLLFILKQRDINVNQYKDAKNFFNTLIRENNSHLIIETKNTDTVLRSH
ncbi:DUF3857 domain-containing protein [Candidatus Poribacteria bacterium]|nr:DUF3857 domain-containing protein [Candidatus Poribacteria bacterium]